MSQQPTQDWPEWITAGTAVIGIIGTFMLTLGKRIFGSVTRKEFTDYLRERDALSEKRHQENKSRLDTIVDDLQDSRERLANIEGRLSP